MSTDKPNSIINALKRLERIGAEDSVTTLKLREAAYCLAEQLCTHIIQHCPPDLAGLTLLPRSYQLEAWFGEAELHAPAQYTLDGEPLNRINRDRRLPSRTAALQFAHDVATGWLDELAQWLEDQTAETAEAVEVLETELAAQT